jgi:hypothetical protein
MESQNRIDVDSYDLPDLKTLAFCPDLQEYFLNTRISSYDTIMLGKMIKEYNQEILQISFDISIQIENGHQESTPKYIEIMKALSQKKLEVNIRNYFSLPKELPRKFFYSRVVLYFLSILLLCSCGYMGYVLLQEINQLPQSNQPKK